MLVKRSMAWKICIKGFSGVEMVIVLVEPMPTMDKAVLRTLSSVKLISGALSRVPSALWSMNFFTTLDLDTLRRDKMLLNILTSSGTTSILIVTVSMRPASLQMMILAADTMIMGRHMTACP